MLFFFKKKDLVVDCFCAETMNFVFHYSPIKYAQDFYPEWWKKLPLGKINFKTMQSEATMKSCMGLINEYKNAMMLSLWTDLIITLDGVSVKYQASTPPFEMGPHPLTQRTGFKVNYPHFKINSPWLFKSEKNVMFQCSEPYYNYPDGKDFDILPGTVDYYYQNATNVNVLVRPKTKEIFIPFETPLYIIKPISERNLVIKNHLISNNEWNNIKKLQSDITFVKKYFSIKRSMENNEKKKCPFGFGSK